jgi:hypothetical protein
MNDSTKPLEIQLSIHGKRDSNEFVFTEIDWLTSTLNDL